MPNMAANKDVNPFTAIGKSWRMTGPSQWVVFGFFIAFLVAMFVAAMVIGVITNALGAIGGILSLLFYLAVAVFGVSLPVGIYRQISPDDAAGVFD